MDKSRSYVNGKHCSIIEIEEFVGVILSDTFDFDVHVCCNEEYSAHSTFGLIDPIPDNRFLRVTVTADALYGSSMRDVVDGLIIPTISHITFVVG